MYFGLPNDIQERSKAGFSQGKAEIAGTHQH